MRRTPILAGAAAVLILALLGWWRFHTRPEPSRPTTSPPSTGNTSPTASAGSSASVAAPSQAQLESDIIRNGVTPESATLLFSVVIAPLPGVTIPSGFARDPAEFDGTLAVEYLYDVWPFLTPEQRQAAAKLVQGKAGAAPAAPAAQPPSILPAVYRPRIDRPRAFDYNQMLIEANSNLAALLNRPAINFLFDVDPDLPENGTAYAETFSWWRWYQNEQPVSEWKEYPGRACHITIFQPKFDTIDETNALAVLTHEMMHCYQQREVGDPNSDISAPAWIKEGEATWAMAAVVPAGSAVVAKYWTAYVESPKTPYMDRSYNAMGVFGHLSDVAGDQSVWPRLLPMMKLGVGGDNEAPFFSLIQGNEDAYLASWGSSYFLTEGQTPWTMTGPGHPPTTGIGPQSMTVAPDSATPIYIMEPYRADMREVTGGADIIGVSLFSGYGRLHDKDFGINMPLDTSGKVLLCVKQGGCRCPDGSMGASFVTKPAAAPIDIGLESGGSTAQMYVAGASLDDFCKKPDKPRPPPLKPGGGGGGGDGGGDNPPDAPPGPGSSHGDTHIVTFDGLRYDFQVIGEYTLVRSTRDDFSVQVRQVPWLKSRTVSVNQAMATKIGARRVTIELEQGVPVLRIDGTPVTGAPPRLPDGSITRADTMYGTTYRLEWADGTKVRVSQLGATVLNVKVEPAEARKGALAGLLGDDDGTPANDLIGAAGAKLGVQPGWQDLTHSLADAWRLAPAASLFDYAAGQSMATFTDPTFPDANVDPSRMPNREAAERNCREMGLTDRHLLDNCILDYAVTSDFLFASSYSQEQQVQAARAVAPPSGPGVLRTVLMTGTVTNPASKPWMQFTANAGDIIWIGHPDCVDQYIEIGIVDPSGKGFSGGSPCAVGRRELPATGTYTMRAYRSDNPLGTYHVPIRIVRPDRQRDVAYGEVIFGRIETPGAHDVYTFTAQAGDLIRLSGDGCALGPLVTGIVNSKGFSLLGPSCRSGTDFKITESGTYRLVVNSGDSASGAYHFVLRGASSK